MSNEVLFEKDGKIAWITLNRPDRLNAMNTKMASGLKEVLMNVREDGELRVVVVRGEGRAFSAGGDLGEFTSGDTSRFLFEVIGILNDCIKLIRRSDKIFLASACGVVSGGGLGLLASCDIAIAAEGTKFNMAYAKIGATPDLSSSLVLARTVGLKIASYLMFTGEFIDAQKALDLGLINFVVPEEELLSRTRELALKLQDVAPLSVKIIKELVNRELFWDLDEILELERQGMSFVGKSEDIKEGIRAFFEKRKPNWQGR